jgi:hypothetical protein
LESGTRVSQLPEHPVVALKLWGNDLFMDFFDDAPFVHALFACVAGTIGIFQGSAKMPMRFRV